MFGDSRIAHQCWPGVEPAAEFHFTIETMQPFVAEPAQHQTGIQLFPCVSFYKSATLVQFSGNQMMKGQRALSLTQLATTEFHASVHGGKFKPIFRHTVVVTGQPVQSNPFDDWHPDLHRYQR